MDKILTAYYGCRGLDYPRVVNYFAILSDSPSGLVFDARSHKSDSTSRTTSNLKLEFNQVVYGLAEKAISLFPLKHVKEFAATKLELLYGCQVDTEDASQSFRGVCEKP